MAPTITFFGEPVHIHILDVGAMLLGKPEYGKLLDAGVARVVGFEPNEEECARLSSTLGEAHRFFPYFVGDGNDAVFHETNQAATGSLFEPNAPLLEKFTNLPELVTLKSRSPVTTTRLDDIAELDAFDVDFLKMDVQGAELSVLRGASKVLSSAVLIQTEVEFVELYVDQPLFADVDSFIRPRGFRFHTFAGISGRCFRPMVAGGDVNRALRQMLWADAVYVYDWLALERLSVEKLKRLCVLLHHQLESFDLCDLVLRHIDQRLGSGYAQRYMQALLAGERDRALAG